MNNIPHFPLPQLAINSPSQLSLIYSNSNGSEDRITITARSFSVAYLNDLAATMAASFVCEYNWACPAGHECVLGSSSQVGCISFLRPHPHPSRACDSPLPY
jgi:hypothetical protein